MDSSCTSTVSPIWMVPAMMPLQYLRTKKLQMGIPTNPWQPITSMAKAARSARPASRAAWEVICPAMIPPEMGAEAHSAHSRPNSQLLMVKEQRARPTRPTRATITVFHWAINSLMWIMVPMPTRISMMAKLLARAVKPVSSMELAGITPV